MQFWLKKFEWLNLTLLKLKVYIYLHVKLIHVKRVVEYVDNRCALGFTYVQCWLLGMMTPSLLTWTLHHYYFNDVTTMILLVFFSVCLYFWILQFITNELISKWKFNKKAWVWRVKRYEVVICEITQSSFVYIVCLKFIYLFMIFMKYKR